MRLVDDHIVERSPREFLMQAGRREVHVARHVVPRGDQQPGQQVLGPAPLVRGDQRLVAVDLAHGVFQVVEVAGSGIGLIPHHHAGPLPVAHGARAGVSEQVDIDVVGLQQEGVVARLAHVAFALRPGGHVDRLDDLDLSRLGPTALSHGTPSPRAVRADAEVAEPSKHAGGRRRAKSGRDAPAVGEAPPS